MERILVMPELEARRRRAVARELLDVLKWKFSELRRRRFPTGRIDTVLWRHIWRENPEMSDELARQQESLHPAFLTFVEREIACSGDENPYKT